MARIGRIALAAAMVLAAVACGDSNEGTVVEVAVKDGRFTTLASALIDTGLDETLSGPGPFTVFAPTDDAFDLLPEGLVDGLDPSVLTAVLAYHVVADELTAAEIIAAATAAAGPSPGSAETAEPEFNVQVIDGTVVLDGRVQVTTTDIFADNGVIHVIDAVLIPGDFPGTVVQALAASPRFSTLAGAVVGEGLATPLSTDNGGDGFTVFAPSNDAFDRLPGDLVASLAADELLDDVLTYHVVGEAIDAAGAIAADGVSVPTLATDAENGDVAFTVAVDVDADGALFLDGRTQVVSTDIVASNGIIHVIDSVLVPGRDFPGTLVEALSAYPRFDTLVGAVVSEGLAGAVTDVTVFAPTNRAFGLLPEGALEDLAEADALSDILAYHLLAGIVDSGSLMATEETLLGDDISIDTSSGVVLNGASNVIFTDLGASDGIVHVIDAVLIPPMDP